MFDNGPGLYAAFFGVPKKDTDELRGCWDGRKLNDSVVYEHFKMEGLQTVRDLLQPGDFMTKVDISDAYPHILVPSRQRLVSCSGLCGRANCISTEACALDCPLLQESSPSS